MESSTTGVQPMTFIAKTISGLEQVLAEEIIALGGENVQVLTRAVSFEGDKRMLYKANYCLRTAQRILVPVYSFQMADEDDLYNQVNSYPWENHLSLTKTLAVDAVTSDSELTHTHYVALLTKDAIVDRFRTLNNGRRPNVDTENPHIRINMHIRGSICDVSIDSSGASLHKRGYRVSNAEAPLSEVLAAGLIMLTGWKRDCHFIDPMCGSGTLVIEAAMYANNFPAGMYRKEYGFMHWPDFDQQLWDEVTQEALDKQTEFEYQIIGSDISPKNLASARANVKSARLHKDIRLHVSPFAALQPPPGDPGLIIINPPYGERIRLNDIIGLYKSIGNTLKQEFTGYQAWVISSDQKALGFIGLRPSAKLPVFNGPLECRFEHFDLYKGSKRGRYLEDKGFESRNTADGKPYSREDRTDWRSKEAPEGKFDSLDPKPRDFRRGREYSRLEDRNQEKPEKRKFESRPLRREEESEERKNKPYKNKPDEFKPRSENFNSRRMKDYSSDDRRGNNEANDRFVKDERPERKKVEKSKLKPITRIEDRNDYLNQAKTFSDQSAATTENIDSDYGQDQVGDQKQLRQPSKGNKFTEMRDSRIIRTRERRPRKENPDGNGPGQTREKSVPKSSGSAPKPQKPQIDYDDLED